MATTNLDSLELSGTLTPTGRLDLSSVNPAAANTDGGVIKAGTSAAPVTEDTANYKFVSLYFDNGATSGDSRAIYNRLYITGAGGGGESLRSFTTVSNVAGATAHGAHISLNFGTTGKLTGLGAAVRATLHIPNQAMAGGGNYTAVQAEIYSDGASSDPAGMTEFSVFRVVNDGNATGKSDVDTDANLFAFNGWTAASGSMIGASVGTSTTLDFANWVPIKIDIEGTTHYLVAAQTIGATGG